jgi:23S rRNA pseudouridine1911/1915/1917 synthase
MTSRMKRKYADLSRPRHTWDLRVEIPEAGMRLDRFLAKRCAWRSRTELQKAIDDGEVTVDGVPRKASTKLLPKQTVVLKLDVPDDVPDPSKIPLDVLHEDALLLVLNKRPGIVVHPVGKQQLTSVLSALHARYRNHDDPSKDRVPHLCHRIDKDTSGVFLVAFDERTKADVSLQFEGRDVKKEYLAIVHGHPDADAGAIDAPLLYEVDAWPRVRVDEAGQPSRTRWRVERRMRDTSLVRFFPETGRMHQIRVHAKHIGHSLVCDTSYGGRGPVADPAAPDAPILGRCALHAARLTVRHPGTGELVTYEAPLAADMAAAVEWLAEHDLDVA